MDFRGKNVRITGIDPSLMGEEFLEDGRPADAARRAKIGQIGRAEDVRLETHREYKTVDPDMYLVDFGGGEILEFAPQEMELA